MKKIIKWLADVSGVTREIQIEACRNCGNSLYWDAYYFSGDIPIYNALSLYSEWLKLGHYGTYGNGMYEIRNKVHELGDTRYDEKTNR